MRLFSIFGKSNVLYYPGGTCFYKHRAGFENYKKVFLKLGIGFEVFEEYVSDGLSALEAGYDQEARKLVRRNFEIFLREDIQKIITTSPESFKMFSQNYPEILPDWSIKLEDIWSLILSRLGRKHRLIKHKAMEVVTFHDSCYLGRYCGIFDSPRRVLELIGYEVKEMDNSKEDSFCCGSCGGLSRVNTGLANKIAKERILQAKRIGVKKMVVIGFDNYDLLRKNSVDSGVEILEFSSVLCKALGIQILEDSEEGIEGEEKILDEDSEAENVLTETKANMRLREELKEEDYYDDLEEDNFK